MICGRMKELIKTEMACISIRDESFHDDEELLHATHHLNEVRSRIHMHLAACAVCARNYQDAA